MPIAQDSKCRRRPNFSQQWRPVIEMENFWRSMPKRRRLSVSARVVGLQPESRDALDTLPLSTARHVVFARTLSGRSFDVRASFRARRKHDEVVSPREICKLASEISRSDICCQLSWMLIRKRNSTKVWRYAVEKNTKERIHIAYWKENHSPNLFKYSCVYGEILIRPKISAKWRDSKCHVYNR